MDSLARADRFLNEERPYPGQSSPDVYDLRDALAAEFDAVMAEERAVLLGGISDGDLVRELNRRLVPCARGHAPNLMMLWPCYRCALDDAAEKRGKASG